MKKLYTFLTFVLMTCSFGMVSGQTTYTWTGSTDNVWTTATNWSPNRNTPATSDIIQFNSGATVTVTGVSAQQIRKLLISDNSNVTLESGSSVYLSILDAAGTELLVSSGCTLTLGANIVLRPYDGSSSDISGTLIVNSGCTFFNDRPTVITTVTGKIVNSGAVTCNNALKLRFMSGSEYEHAKNGDPMPIATWNSASLCKITGSVTLPPTSTSLEQSFGNFTWNCAGQTATLPLDGYLTAVTGTFTIASTGTGILSVEGSATYGNYTQTGGTYFLSTIGGFPFTLTVTGNFSMAGGTFMMSNVDEVGTLNIAGNFSHTAGTINENSSGTGTGAIVFNGTSTQLYTSGGTTNGTIHFTVNSGATLQMGSGASPAFLTGTDATFTLSSGGTLGITGSNGITLSGLTGNIRVGGTRTYSAGANYIYNGTGAQSTGAGLPIAAISGNITVESGSIVQPWSDITANGNLTVNGTLDPASDRLIKGTGTITGTGTVKVSRTTSGSASFLGQYTISNKSINDLTVNYTATAGNQSISALGYGNLTLSNTSGTNSLAGAATVNGTLTTTAGGTFNIGTNQLSVNNLTNNGSIFINSTSLTNNGSFIATGSLSQSGTVTYNRQLRLTGNYGERHFFSSPVGGNTAANSGKVTSVWSWEEPTGTWPTTVITGLGSGVGYNLEQTGGSDGLISFTGSLVTSATITASSPYATANVLNTEEEYTDRWANHSSRTEWGGGGWNLIGNPFTSAMNASTFLSVNQTSFDPNYTAVYVYNGIANEYDFNNTSIQAGQGFFVLADMNGVDFSFTRAMQQHDPTGAMLKSSNIETPWPGIQLMVKYGDFERKTSIVYNENMKTGLDPGYDVGQLSTNPSVEIYTALVANDNGVNFARQALPVTDCEKNIIPVGIDAPTGQTVTFYAIVEPLPGNKFFLEDRLTGTFTDLNSKTYSIYLPDKTYGTGRFFVHTSFNTPTAINPPEKDSGQGLRIWTSNEKIIIKGPLGDKASCTMYDLRGQKVLEIRLSGGDLNTVSLPSAAKGVYIVSVRDGSKVTTQKVVIM